MERQDRDLAFMLQYENIAWYESGSVRILDRRVYPRQVSFVVCHRHEEVAQAITDMVTQSAGPFTAAAMGMALAAWECREKTEKEQLVYLEDAARTISNARPTTRARMQLVTGGCLAEAKAALKEGRDVPEAIVAHTVAANDLRYAKIGKIAEYLVDLFPDDGTILTQCFAETIVGQMLKTARLRGKRIKLVCAETRPYFQGARLTATVARDMGVDVTVITDNMPAWYMKSEKIDAFTCAADVICCDGHVVNKIGTMQIALCAREFGVPVYVTGAPDRAHETIDSVKIEMRDPAFVLQAMGVKTAADGVKGWYPAFDVTPPKLIDGIVTDLGVYSPFDLKRYFDAGTMGEYEMIL